MKRLDATLQSTLEWEIPREDQIDWFLDMGLFHQLTKPLGDQMQFQTFILALDHFMEKIWHPHPQKTRSLCLYKGTGDFSLALGGSPLQARALAAEYLITLVEALPEEVPLTLKLDVSNIENPLLQAQLLDREVWQRFKLDVIGEKIPLNGIDLMKEAVLVPVNEGVYTGLERLVRQFVTEQKPFRLIPEGFLTLEWHGLDKLYAAKEVDDLQVKRRIQGFEAAGGVVVYV